MKKLAVPICLILLFIFSLSGFPLRPSILSAEFNSLAGSTIEINNGSKIPSPVPPHKVIGYDLKTYAQADPQILSNQLPARGYYNKNSYARLSGNIVVSGYVREEGTNTPIYRAYVTIREVVTDSVIARVFTNESGYYSTNVLVAATTEREQEPDTYWVSNPAPNPVSLAQQKAVSLLYTVPKNRRLQPKFELYDVIGRRVNPEAYVAAGIYSYRLLFDDGEATEARKLVVSQGGRLSIQLNQVLKTIVQEQGLQGEGINGKREQKLTLSPEMVDVRIVVDKSGYRKFETLYTLPDSAPVQQDFTLAASPAPTASFSISASTQAGLATVFEAIVGGGLSPDSLTFSWDFGDELRGGGRQIGHIYTAGGTYTVRLTTANADGATSSVTQQVSISDPPAPAGTARVRLSVTEPDSTFLEGVQVAVVNSTLNGVTNGDGTVLLNGLNTGVPSTLKFSKPGYADQYVQLDLPASSKRIEHSVVMTKRAAPIAIEDVEDGVVQTGLSGVRIEIPPDALIDAAGQPVFGAAELSLTPINVADDDEIEAFPGEFSGLLPAGETVPIATYGVAEYVFTKNGQKLQLAPGKKAIIDIPSYVTAHPDGHPIVAGDTLPVWSLNEETGIWTEEGKGIMVQSSASPTGLVQRAEVTHLSWWNCDYPTTLFYLFVVVPTSVFTCKIMGGGGGTLNPDGTCRSKAGDTLFYSRLLNIKAMNRGGSSVVSPRSRVEGYFTPQLTNESLDTDEDGEPNSVDFDDDNDEIPDWKDPDDDNDEIPDGEDFDADNDGTPDPWNNIIICYMPIPEGENVIEVQTAPTLVDGKVYIGRWRGTVNNSTEPTVIIRDAQLTFDELDRGGEGEVIVLPDTIEGAINPVGEIDRYSIVGKATDMLTLHVERIEGSGLQGTMKLFDPFGDLVGQVSFGAQKGLLNYIIPESGNYIVEVDGTAAEPDGYRLSALVKLVAELDSTNSGTNMTSNHGQFYFTLAEEQEVVIAHRATGENPVRRRVYDAEGKPVPLETGPLGYSTGQWADLAHKLAAGTYTVVLEGDDRELPASFEFIIRTVTEGIPAELNLTQSGEIERPFDLARYSFTLTEEQEVVIAHRATGENPVIRRVYDAEGKPVPLETGPLGYSAGQWNDRGHVLPSGTYTIVLEGDARELPASFEFMIRTLEGPQPIELGTTHQKTIGKPFEYQQFSFTLAEETAVTIRTIAENIPRLQVTLKTASGTQLETKAAIGTTPSEIKRILPAGNYIIQQDPNGDSVGSYSFSLSKD